MSHLLTIAQRLRVHAALEQSEIIIRVKPDEARELARQLDVIEKLADPAGIAARGYFIIEVPKPLGQVEIAASAWNMSSAVIFAAVWILGAVL